MQNQKQSGIDKCVDEGHMEGYFMRRRGALRLVVIGVRKQGYEKQGSPENEVGNSDHSEHFDAGYALSF